MLYLLKIVQSNIISLEVKNLYLSKEPRKNYWRTFFIIIIIFCVCINQERMQFKLQIIS